MSADTPRRLGRGLEAIISTAKQQRDAPGSTIVQSATPVGAELQRIPVADIAPIVPQRFGGGGAGGAGCGGGGAIGGAGGMDPQPRMELASVAAVTPSSRKRPNSTSSPTRPSCLPGR